MKNFIGIYFIYYSPSARLSIFYQYLRFSVTKTGYHFLREEMMFMKYFGYEALESPQVKEMTEIQNILII